MFRLELDEDSLREMGLRIAAVPCFRLRLDGKWIAVEPLQFTPDQVFPETVRPQYAAGADILPPPDAAKYNIGLAPWRCRREYRLSFSWQPLKGY